MTVPDQLTVTVTYDNNPFREGLDTDWGFSCLITGREKTILFDTGGSGSLLLENMNKLAIEPTSAAIVVLSHIHGDHTGGLDAFLQTNNRVTVYLPKAFPKSFINKVESTARNLVEISEPTELCENVYSTGQIGHWIKEQALVVRTEKGAIVVTGCAHPGIVKMAGAAKELTNNDIVLLIGGFHLEWARAARIEKIASTLMYLGVRFVAPCHCTGKKARAIFEKHFGSNYLRVGAGVVISVPDLQ